MQLIDPAKAYKQEQPEFGNAMRKHFALDPSYINLNHGSYGTTPRPVLQAVSELTTRIEANPDLFHRVEFKPLLVESRKQVAALIGAKTDEVVLVSNASMGVNAVLRNFEWEEGDIIFSFTTTYGSVSRTVQSIADVSPHPTASVIALNFPTTHEEILKGFKEHIQATPAKPNKKRVAVIDSIVSNPGALLPWKEMVAICKEEDVWSVIDAAHSIGQEVGLNLTEIGPDFWISNCHKWLYAKRSCAVLYVPERNQHIIKTSIPTSAAYISPAKRTGPNFVAQFEWNGTIDYAPYLTVVDALEFREWLGGEEKINEYCHNLAIKGGQALAKVLGTHVLDPEGHLTLNMVNVALPLPGSLPENLATNASIRNGMLNKKAYSAHFRHNGVWYTRCSAQVWNEVSDFENLGKKWLEVCADVKKEFGVSDDK
ncbi:pyridoxal phosphate-dependent transferase [Flammula alnicola]|nr:pyridoxal phosphate-dependent transferase [Flammula alnicola]